MKGLCTFTSLMLLVSTAVAQEPGRATISSMAPLEVSAPIPGASGAVPAPCLEEEACCRKCLLAGTHDFDCFIGFMSNPIQNIDPRAMTAIWPVFGSTWFSTHPALPGGNLQLYGAGLTVALGERFAFGLNQGGYGMAYFNRDQPGLFTDSSGRIRDRSEFAGQREGWLDLGGFGQFTLIKNVPNQCLLTMGVRWQTATGSSDIFEGSGPVHLAPYATLGKGFGNYHFLVTTGYQFAIDSDDHSTDVFYANWHLDRQIGWLYPLVEFNWTYHRTGTAVDLPTRRGFVDFNNFESTGNILTLAAGVNAVIVRGKLEFGAVYTTELASQRDFEFNGVLAKMLLRY
jgi:hypothetical protein